MQILWSRITPVIPTAFFTLAIVAIVATRANADSTKTYGTVNGTLTITAPADSYTQTWSDDLKPHYRMRADESYTAESVVSCDAEFNPHGSVGIRRFFQTGNLSSSGPLYMASLTPQPIGWEVTDTPKLRPANSPFTPSHTTTDYGPYTPDLSYYLNSNGVLANEVCGVETIALVFDDSDTGTETIIDYQRIDILGPKSSNAANFYVQNFRSQVALNTDTTKPYLGDPPRVTLTASNIYPGTKFWVVIYPGSAQTTPPAGAKTISSTVKTAPNGGNWTYPTGIYLDVGNYVTGSGTYTVQAMQQSTTNSQIGTETFGSAASFSLKTKYNVTSQLGLSK